MARGGRCARAVGEEAGVVSGRTLTSPHAAQQKKVAPGDEGVAAGGAGRSGLGL